MAIWRTDRPDDEERNDLASLSAHDAATVEEAVESIRNEVGDFEPDVMILFGSGLSEALRPATITHSIPYARTPGLVAPTTAGHPGRIAFGSWHAHRVMAFQGRLHWHEGHSWSRVTLPVLIAAEMGASICVLTNMSGAIQPRLKPGAMLAIDDHMNFMGSNPLIGATANDPANMYPDMQEAYSRRLRKLLDDAARQVGVPLAHGVYVGVSGPNYETPAEVRALGLLGADVVGMSTVGEVLVARQLGLECCAISCVANMAAGVGGGPIRHQDVLQVAHDVALPLSMLLDGFLRLL